MAYPNLKQSVWLLAIFWLIVVGFVLIVSLLGTALGRDLLANPYVNAFMSLVTILLVVVYAKRRTDRAWPDILLFNAVPWRLFLPLSVSTVGLSIAISIVESALHYLLPIPESIAKVFLDLVWKETPFAFAFYNLVVQPSLAEEVLFRGVILIGLLAHQPRKRAIVWSATLFALFHLMPWQFPAAFVLGVVFAWWVIQTGSLLPAIAGHALNNSLFLIAARYELLGPADDFNRLVFLPWWLQLCGIALTLVGLVWFNQMAQRVAKPVVAAEDQEPA